MTTIVYIMGHGFSGSTLLTLLLGAHPAIATTGEAEIVADAKAEHGSLTCSCGQPFAECGFWQATARGMAERGHPYHVVEAGALELRAPHDRVADLLLRLAPRPPLLEAARRLALALLPGARRSLDKQLARNAAFIDTVTGLKGCRVFVDATKRPERALHLRGIPGATVKVVHLVRDGRAVACSAMTNLGQSPAVAARSWLRCDQACGNARRQFPPGHWHRLRYEDLCRDPAAALAGLHRFIGVPELPPSRDVQAGQHVIGNRMRLRAVGEISADERWRRTLAAEDRAVIEGVLGAANRRHGYTD